jgi:hypothetical protein
MTGLDAAVEDADADAGARRAAEGPLPRHLCRPTEVEADAVDSVGRETPRGQFLVALVQSEVGCDVQSGHADDSISAGTRQLEA